MNLLMILDLEGIVNEFSEFRHYKRERVIQSGFQGVLEVIFRATNYLNSYLFRFFQLLRGT